MMIRLEFEALAEAELKRAIEHGSEAAAGARPARSDGAVPRPSRRSRRADRAGDRDQPGATRWPSISSATRACGRASWDEGIAALQKSIWLNPFYSAPYILLGRAYMQKGQPATAEGHADARHRVRPEQPLGALPARAAAAADGPAEEAKREFAIAERLQGQAGR